MTKREEVEIRSEGEPISVASGADITAKSLGETVLDFIGVVTKWRRFIAWFVLSATVLTAIITLTLPKWYKATASVFPAEQTDLFSGLEGISSLMKTFSPGGKLASLTRSSESDRYIAILKSDNALTKVIDKFDLTKLYGITTYPHEKTVKELLSNTEVEVADEGNLWISVYDKDPDRAAAMANYFVDVLNEINAELQVQNARANREFIEQRYNKNLVDLHNAEEALREYQEKSGVMITPEQGTSSVSAIAELYGMKAKKEIEAAVLERTVTKDNSTLQQLRIELSEINKKIASFPQTAVESFRRYRDVAIQQKIVEFLVPLYEQAKVEEKRNTPSVIVLDRALVPERKARPRVALYTLLAFVVSSVVSMFMIFCAEGIARIKATNPERFDGLVRIVRSDWFGLRFRRKARGG